MKHEGYLVIDHRASPGIKSESNPLLGEGKFFEAATLSCNHCRCSVIMNPDRIRVRGHCPKCDEYLCDGCMAAYNANFICKPFEQVVMEVKTGITPMPILARDLVGV